MDVRDHTVGPFFRAIRDDFPAFGASGGQTQNRIAAFRGNLIQMAPKGGHGFRFFFTGSSLSVARAIGREMGGGVRAGWATRASGGAIL